jgi:late competence protein required for DNA uptake (superfamily II DNA/RNA helicase)
MKNVSKKTKTLCDRCHKPKREQEYVGYGMMYCQECIKAELVRMPGGHFRFKTNQEMERDDQ